MRISELSAASGASIPTIKFYLREGLLEPGTSAGRRRATYGERHVRRLRLIRALTEVGRMTLGDVRRVLTATDDTAVSRHDLLGTAQYALEPSPPRETDPEGLAAGRQLVDELLADLGWRVSAAAPARETLAHAVVALRGLGWELTPDRLRPYADAVDALAEREVAMRAAEPSRESMVERMVVGSVLFEAVMAAIRRLAHEHHSARLG